jgi:hypothetical protein
MKIVEDTKDILSNHYDQIEIYDLIGDLDNEEDDMSCATQSNEMNVVVTSDDGYEIEVNFTTHYNVNEGYIKVSKDEDVKEMIPLKYEVDPA